MTNGNNYLTIPKLTSYLSTLLTIIVPLTLGVLHIDGRLNDLETKLAVHKNVLECVIMTIDKGYETNVCSSIRE